MTTLLDKVFGTYVGLEFKEDSIVVAFLKNNFSGITLLSSSTFPLRYDDTVSDEIRQYISKHGINVNKVFVSIPDKWAITKFVDVPSMKGKGKGAIANLMRFEIERHIPFQIDDVAYDSLVMDEKDMKYSMVFVAVQNEKIDFIKDFLEKLSLKSDAITISSFAVLNTIELSGVTAGGWQEISGIVRKSDLLGRKGETNISLCIGKTNASISIIKDGLCTHLRSFLFDISQPSDVFLIETAKYLAEIKSSLGIERFHKLLLSGDISSLAELKSELNEKLKIDVVTVDQISNFSGGLEGIEINGILSSIGACFAGLGIGTYKINLLPHKIDYEIKKIAPFATKIFLVLILILVIGIFTTEAVKQKQFLAEMEEALKKNEPRINAVEKLTSDIDSFKQRSDLLHNVIKNELSLEILSELASILPKDSWITNLSYRGIVKDKKRTGSELVISGYAASSSTLIPLLEDSPFFEKVEFMGSIKKARDKEQFKLSARIVRPLNKKGNER
jgi:Tfp pilus assembly PilM family ATPase/Tfp pilus assembly protein PilN